MVGSIMPACRRSGERPADHLGVGRSGQAPLPTLDDTPQIPRKFVAIEVADRAGGEHGIDRQGTLHAAMRALRISVMEVRAHDAEGEVPLDVLVESRPLVSAAEDFLSGEQETAAKKRADRRA
jgi:hypothetical protein